MSTPSVPDAVKPKVPIAAAPPTSGAVAGTTPLGLTSLIASAGLKVKPAYTLKSTLLGS